MGAVKSSAYPCWFDDEAETKYARNVKDGLVGWCLVPLFGFAPRPIVAQTVRLPLM